MLPSIPSVRINRPEAYETQRSKIGSVGRGPALFHVPAGSQTCKQRGIIFVMSRRSLFPIQVTLPLVFVLVSCAGSTGPSVGRFKDPEIALHRFEVPQYDGFWYYSSRIEPTKGEPENRGAPLPLSFLFAIRNPNLYPVALEGYSFTVAFEGFDLITVNNSDTYWIAPGEMGHVRATTLITAQSALLSLMGTGGYKLKERGWSAWDAIERWWKGVPDYSISVIVKEGAFTFKAKDRVRVLPFQAKSS